MSNLNGSKIKSLQSMISKAEVDILNLNKQKDQLIDDIVQKKHQIKKYTKEIDNIKVKSKEIIVSEHAIIRYLERVYGLDLLKIENEILPEREKEKIKLFGNGQYSVENFTVKVVDNVVVTVIDGITG